MDDKNQNSEPQQPQNPQSPNTQPPVVSSVYPEPTKGVGSTPSYSKSDFEKENKQHKQKKLLVASIVFILFVLGIVGLMLGDANLRAAVLHQKFVEYTYDNGKGNSYKLEFYRGAKIESVNISGNSENFIVSPSFSNGSLPIEMNIAQSDSTASIQAYQKNNDCPNGSLTLTVYVASANTNANLCSYGSTYNSNVLIDLVSFESNNQVYVVTIAQKYNLQLAKTDLTYAKSIVNKLNLTPYNSDLKTIVASIKPI